MDAETEFDLDESVAAQAGAHRQRDAGVDDLEVRHLDPLTTTADLSPSRQGSRTELDAECGSGFGRRNNDDGRLNLEHRNLLNEQHEPDPAGRIPGVAGPSCRERADQVIMGCPYV